MAEMPPYAYLRKSSVRNAETDLSPETQEREIRALAQRHNDNGSKLVMLADWDISGRGKFTKKRRAYQQLLTAIEAGHCSAVYSYSLSRLGRSVHELSGLFDLCADRHVPIRLVADSVDTSTASGVMVANMLSSVAQFEADVASERTKAAQATRRARGERVGPRNYGEGDGEDSTAVLDAFHEAGSYHGAAKLLNEREVPTRHGRKGWWASSVAKMVQRLDPSIRPGTARRKAVPPAFTLARLLACPTCLTPLGGKTDAGKWTRYVCSRATALPHPRRAISEQKLMPAIRAEVAHLATPESVLSDSDADAKRADLEQRKARVLDMYESGHIDKAERDRRLDTIYEAMQLLDDKRVVLSVPKVDWSWSPRELNAVLRALFTRIELDPVTFQPTRFEWTVPEWRA